MNTGLLIGGRYVMVPGLEVTAPSPRSPAWCRLDPADYRPRKTKWVRQILIHTTKGRWPQIIRPGAGPHGREQTVADFWRGDPKHSAAQLVIGSDGKVGCLCDLATIGAYHATVSNDWSIGIEIYQEADGSIYEAALQALVLLVPVLCETLSIPFQIAGDRYANAPIERMTNGGPDCVGIFGHRDNTGDRGRGDPGDEVYLRLVDAGAESLAFGARGDIGAWTVRQRRLNAMGEQLAVDGICGPSTIAALRRRGFKSGRELDAAVEAG